MAELKASEAKLVQYLGEAHAKEKELETSLQAHIAMTTRAPYKKRLQQHLKETRDHARRLERRMKKLGGASTVQQLAETAQTAVGKGVAAVKGPIDTLRGMGEEEQMLKNAQQEFSEEAKEIATYRSIEAFAEKVGDRETAQLAKSIRREEERMASFLERQIPTLTNAVAQAEVPASERDGGGRRSSRRSSSGRASSSRSRAASSSRGRSSSSSKSRSGSSSRGRSSSSSKRSSSGSRKRSSASSRGRSSSGSRARSTSRSK